MKFERDGLWTMDLCLNSSSVSNLLYGHTLRFDFLCI